MRMLPSLFIALLLSMLLVAPVLADEPVNINTAKTQELIEGLSGVGPVKARAIIAYREEHGLFEFSGQLREVKGIGPVTMEKNRDRITVGEKENDRSH